MSNQRVQTSIIGYEEQVFPTNLDELNRIYDLVGGNGIRLEEIGRTMEGYEARNRPTTSDGYGWFWGLSFSVGANGVLVAFPWKQDWTKKDGTQLDRSIAVYTKNKISISNIDGLIGKLSQGFIESREKEERERKLRESSLVKA